MADMREITLTRPDDWHVHLRDGDYLATTVPHISRYFGRALVMPNLVPPVQTVKEAEAYRQRILGHVPDESDFEPLMTLYLTDQTALETIHEAGHSPIVVACKLYPAGATTHSDSGVRGIEKLYPVFEAMQEAGLVLSLHGEITDPDTDIFDREKLFIERHLSPLVRRFPQLKVVLEHITTSEAVAFVESETEYVAATITVHHLMYNRTHMLAGGIKPLYYCLPVLKRDSHQLALIKAATSGHKRFFLGTDSAPHTLTAKSNPCGCAAGIYTAHAALELYAQVFDSQQALDKLEGFASLYGAQFYGLKPNQTRIQLTEESWRLPSDYALGDDRLKPLPFDETLHWTVRRLP